VAAALIKVPKISPIRVLMAKAAAAATVALMFLLLPLSPVLALAKETQAIGKLQKIVIMSLSP
jgi:hypothetical protein